MYPEALHSELCAPLPKLFTSKTHTHKHTNKGNNLLPHKKECKVLWRLFLRKSASCPTFSLLQTLLKMFKCLSSWIVNNEMWTWKVGVVFPPLDQPKHTHCTKTHIHPPKLIENELRRQDTRSRSWSIKHSPSFYSHFGLPMSVVKCMVQSATLCIGRHTLESALRLEKVSFWTHSAHNVKIDLVSET